MKKTAIIIGIVIIGVSVYLFTTQDFSKDIETQPTHLGITFDVAVETIGGVTFTTSDIRFATTTDNNNTTVDGKDIEIKTGLAIPINIATSTGSIDETIVMNFDGYNQCRFNGKSKTVCLGELDDDIQQNIDAFKQNKIKEFEELDIQKFQDEIIL